MMLYALGALEIFDGIYDIDSVRMTIYQPRKSNISVCVMEKDGLLEWAQNDLTYKAKLHTRAAAIFTAANGADSARQRPNAGNEPKRISRLPGTTLRSRPS